jgi:hypothetical protein
VVVRVATNDETQSETQTRYGNNRADLEWEDWFLELLRDSDTSTTPPFIPKVEEDDV